MALKNFIAGFAVKVITGFDDTLTQIPIAASITKTKKGRIAFSIGIFSAIILASLIALLFASFINRFPFSRYISASLLIILAVLVHFQILVSKPKEKVGEKIQKEAKPPLTLKRFFKLIFLGFIAAFATVIDDTIAYSPLFSSSLKTAPFTIAGILTATLIQVTLLIYFSKKISKIKWKKEITSMGLVILAVLILLEVI